jgi:hypothetical protein
MDEVNEKNQSMQVALMSEAEKEHNQKLMLH